MIQAKSVKDSNWSKLDTTSLSAVGNRVVKQGKAPISFDLIQYNLETLKF